MKVIITRQVQEQMEVDVQFPAYYQCDGSYYLIASEEKVVRITALSEYACISTYRILPSELSNILSGEQITKEEYGAAFKKATNIIWNVVPEDSEAIDNLLKEAV